MDSNALTPVIVAVIGGVFALIQAVAKYYIDKRVKTQQLRDVLDSAVNNSLGVIQQAASGQASKVSAGLIGLVPDSVAPGVQYVLDHADEAVGWFGLTPESIVEKIVSRIGLKEIATNLAVTSSAATPAVISPLAPSAPSEIATKFNRESLTRNVGAKV